MRELHFENGFFDLEGRRVEATPATVAPLRDWARRYDEALAGKDDDALLPIGRETADWLDRLGFEGAAEDDGKLVFATPARPNADELAFLDAPWELLSDKEGFLARRDVKPYQPARRLGPATKPLAPVHSDIFALFMAAAPVDQHELAYEAEEAAILQATRKLDLQLVVEESGALEPLRDRLAREAPIEALHLSCHGDVDKKGAFLCLEDDFGGIDAARIDDFAAALGEAPPPLIFLSACRTAEQTAGGRPFALELAAIAPNLVGWDGSVWDRDAISFAEAFYAEIALGRPVPLAAAAARRELLKSREADRKSGAGLHWHLARVYLGPGGGGALRGNGLTARPRIVQGGEFAFLGGKKDAPVASPAVFVGRRRETQTALRAFRDRSHAGILIRGMGRLGKSSLASRIGDRLPHHKVALVFKAYDAQAIFTAMVEATAPQGRADLRTTWSAAIRSPEGLRDALQAILLGPASAFDEKSKKQPILLVVDDLERILEDPRPGEVDTRVKSAFRDSLAAILLAFAATRETSPSRLLLTSRYAFELQGERGDLAAELFDLQLPPMNARQRDKLVESAARVEGKPVAETEIEARWALLARASAAAEGNPGLQALLMRPVLRNEALGVAETAISAVEAYRRDGTAPTKGDLGQFFTQLTLENYRRALTPDETRQARAALLFVLPVPRDVMEATGAAAGVADPRAAIERLVGLGCFDAFHSPLAEARDAPPELALNALARPLFAGLPEPERRALAKVGAEALYAARADEDGNVPADPQAEELARLALVGGARPEVVDKTTTAAAYYLHERRHDARAALAMVEEALAAIEAQGGAPSFALLQRGIAAAERIGEVDRLDAFLAQAALRSGDDERSTATLQLYIFNRLIQRGALDGALQAARAAEAAFARLGDVRSRAVTMGQIADILASRGELDEALRIRQKEQLPVYERLGDVRERAVTMGKIADILSSRGELDEALQILREDLVPVFERLGDIRERAVTMGQIADILDCRGERDEALQILREDLVPVFERLGDVRERAVTMGQIADILASRGELDEALRIRREEEIPVYERLGDVRERAVAMGQIADILFSRGDLDEALRIRRQEEIPVYERLGDVRERAVAMGKIADILFSRGDLDEALRIHFEERLPVARRMQDRDSIAHVLFSCARIRLRKGLKSTEAAQSVFDELREAFELSLAIQRADFVAGIGDTFGQFLEAAGQPESAVAVYRQSAAAFRKLDRLANAEDVEARIAAIEAGGE